MPIRFCARCKKLITGELVSYGEKSYHKNCFVCAYCGHVLEDSVATYAGQLYHSECNPVLGKPVCAYCRKPLLGAYYILKDKYYHRDCYHDHIEKKCCVCCKPIGDSAFIYDTWGNFAHLIHGLTKTQFCFSCGRILSVRAKAIGSNAKICNVCSPSAVTSYNQVESCREKVLDLFRSLGITGVPENIPVELKCVDLMGGALGRIRFVERKGRNFSDFRMEIVRALPELHFRGVLAHEMLHAWLALYGREVTDDECEGFCDLGSGFVYQKEDTAFAKYLLKRLYENEDRIYGDGYRLQKERYGKLGWKGLLESLRRK